MHTNNLLTFTFAGPFGAQLEPLMISVNSAKRFKWQRTLCLNVTVTVKCTLHQSAAIISFASYSFMLAF